MSTSKLCISQVGWVERSETQRWNSFHSFQPTASWLLMGMHQFNVDTAVVYAETHYAGKYTRLDIRFRGLFCYIDAYTEPTVPTDFSPLGFPESPEEYFTRVRSTPYTYLRAPSNTLDLIPSLHPTASLDQIIQIAADSEIACYHNFRRNSPYLYK